MACYEKVLSIRGQGQVRVAVQKDGIQLEVIPNGLSVLNLSPEQGEMLEDILSTANCYFGNHPLAKTNT